MLTAKIISTDKSYSINLPKAFNLNFNLDEEVYINKIGDVVMMTPTSRLADALERGAKILAEFAPDFMSGDLPESIEAILS